MVQVAVPLGHRLEPQAECRVAQLECRAAPLEYRVAQLQCRVAQWTRPRCLQRRHLQLCPPLAAWKASLQCPRSLARTSAQRCVE